MIILAAVERKTYRIVYEAEQKAISELVCCTAAGDFELRRSSYFLNFRSGNIVP